MLATIRAAYEARVSGDLNGVVSAFTDDAVFRLNAAPLHQVTTVHATDGNELKSAMAQLIDSFEFSDFEIVDSVIEGDKAAIRSMFTVRSKRTGNATSTEAFDLIRFKNGKICSFTQFFDTAVAHDLMFGKR